MSVDGKSNWMRERESVHGNPVKLKKPPPGLEKQTLDAPQQQKHQHGLVHVDQQEKGVVSMIEKTTMTCHHHHPVNNFNQRCK